MQTNSLSLEGGFAPAEKWEAVGFVTTYVTTTKNMIKEIEPARKSRLFAVWSFYSFVEFFPQAAALCKLLLTRIDLG